MNGKKCLDDRKGVLSQLFWGPINRIVLALKFRKIEIAGSENIPAAGPFLLVSNHSSRWDGLLVQSLVARPANFLVSPNELKGFQGNVLRSMGAFPANPRYDLLDFFCQQVKKGEGVVIFPEGNIFRDGAIHPFKNGAARMALNCSASGLRLPVLPMAVAYCDELRTAKLTVGQAVELEPFEREFANQSNIGMRSLTVRLEREVCLLRHSLAAQTDSLMLFTGKPLTKWVPRGFKVSEQVESNRTDSWRPAGRVLSVENGPANRDRAQHSAEGLLGRAV
jgi:1-acyl-sn-glycerol-3-phosphate acyltransferase